MWMTCYFRVVQAVDGNLEEYSTQLNSTDVVGCCDLKHN